MEREPESAEKQGQPEPACPKCGSKQFRKTGLGHGVGAVGVGGKLPSITRVQVRCLRCDHRWDVPGSLGRR